MAVAVLAIVRKIKLVLRPDSLPRARANWTGPGHTKLSFDPHPRSGSLGSNGVTTSPGHHHRAPDGCCGLNGAESRTVIVRFSRFYFATRYRDHHTAQRRGHCERVPASR